MAGVVLSSSPGGRPLAPCVGMEDSDRLQLGRLVSRRDDPATIGQVVGLILLSVPTLALVRWKNRESTFEPTFEPFTVLVEVSRLTM